MKRFLLAAIATVATWTGINLPAAKAETILAVTQVSYDAAGQQTCAAVRMNPSAFDPSSLPSSACTLGTTSPTYGPDRITQNVYDAAGQVQQVWQAVGTSAQRVYATYSYSNNGKVIDTVDANGNRTTLAYDGFDRPAALYYPSTTRPSAYNPSTPANALATAGAYNPNDYETYGYDSNGNRTSWRRRDGNTFSYSYDNLNREMHKGGSAIADMDTGYDLLGHVLYKRFSSSGQGVSYIYDALGRVSQTTDYNGRTIWYGYNEASARTQLTFPDINNFTYALDNANRIKTVGLNANSGLASFGYDSLGRLTGVGRLGGSTSYTYDNLGRLQTMSNDLNGTGYDIGWTFAYTPAGQLYTSSASSTDYDYKETVNSADSPTYDGLNRDSRLVGTTTACPSGGYDARQNLICDSLQTPNRTFTYDAENRMLSGVSTSANVRMVYDPEGRLAKYSVDGGSTWSSFLYDGVNLIAIYAPSGGMSARFLHGGGTDNPLVWLVGADNNNMRPLYTDYHGSVIADTDSAGNLIDLYKYGPYGEPKDISNNEFWGGSPFRYTGQLALSQLQLYYYKARVYDPRWGRFLQTDPIGSTDDLDLYAYTGNDPINKADPSGLQGNGYWDRFWRGFSTGTNYYSLMHYASGQEDSITIPKAGTPEKEGFDWGYGFGAGLNQSYSNVTSGTFRGNISVPHETITTVTPGSEPVITAPYSRPNNATTPAQRASVQGQPCVDCGAVGGTQRADHKTPLVVEYYTTGKIDKDKMKSLDAVQPQCADCSNSQGGTLKKYSDEQKKKHGL